MQAYLLVKTGLDRSLQDRIFQEILGLRIDGLVVHRHLQGWHGAPLEEDQQRSRDLCVEPRFALPTWLHHLLRLYLLSLAWVIAVVLDRNDSPGPQNLLLIPFDPLVFKRVLLIIYSCKGGALIFAQGFAVLWFFQIEIYEVTSKKAR